MTIQNAPIPIAKKTGRVALIVDQSGSMLAQTKDTIGTINNYIDGLKLTKQNMLISLYTFDSYRGIKRLLNDIDVEVAPVITEAHYSPGGGTPLYQAVAEVITTTEFPSVVVIITDGEDTSGVNPSAVKALIASRREIGWEFLFLGAGLDRWAASAISGAMGMASNRTMNYSRGQQADAMNVVAGATAAYAASGFSAGASFDLAQDKQDLTQVLGDTGIVAPPETVHPKQKKGGVMQGAKLEHGIKTGTKS